MSRQKPRIPTLQTSVPDICDRRVSLAPLIGESPIWKAMVATTIIAAQSMAPLLFFGEPGSGKTAVALHAHVWSGRVGPTTIISCADRQHTAMLFNLHLRPLLQGLSPEGSALLRAHEGTVLVDDIDRLSRGFQDDLCEFLDALDAQAILAADGRALSLRFIATSTLDPRDMANDGPVRSDLVRRLSSIMIRVPALRERGRDAVLMARRLVAHPERIRITEPNTVNLGHARPDELAQYIMDMLESRGQITPNDLRPFGFSYDEAAKRLDAAARDRLLLSLGRGRSKRYILPPSQDIEH